MKQHNAPGVKQPPQDYMRNAQQDVPKGYRKPPEQAPYPQDPYYAPPPQYPPPMQGQYIDPRYDRKKQVPPPYRGQAYGQPPYP